MVTYRNIYSYVFIYVLVYTHMFMFISGNRELKQWNVLGARDLVSNNTILHKSIQGCLEKWLVLELGEETHKMILENPMSARK